MIVTHRYLVSLLYPCVTICVVVARPTNIAPLVRSSVHIFADPLYARNYCYDARNE